MHLADRIGLTPEQESRAQRIDEEVNRHREALAVWHRLLDRRRLDVKRGLHSVPAVALAGPKVSGEQGALVRKDPEEPACPAEREPFLLRSENEATALLMRCVGYLSNEAGEKLAFDKGVGQKDKMAEWIIMEIKTIGGSEYIRRHRPHVFGMELRMSD